MNQDLQKSKWEKLIEKLEQRFGMPMDYTGILFLIGLQELGKPAYQPRKKDEKLSILHIAVCTLLEPYGIYEYIGRDEERWPHWQLKEELPPLSDAQQNKLITEAIIDYFEKQNFLDE
ncbi:MAG: hypothetical protein Fur0023_18760 [Bacteroidia bacterium]